jgi:hypothetical protein
MGVMRSLAQQSRPRPDYRSWSIEELKSLAAQLRVSGARAKSRRELIDFFAVEPKKSAAHRPKELM